MTAAPTHDPTERAAFLAAIAADPADDTVRGAYADWLDEHPDVDDGRAELIRAQVELARLRVSDNCPKCNVSLSPLKKDHLPLLAACLKCGHAVGFWNDVVGEARNRTTLAARERALLAAHELRWRSAGACPVCGGDGTVDRRVHESRRCQACGGCGDAGMLTGRCSYCEGKGHGFTTQSKCIACSGTGWTYPVEFRRGFVESITAPRLADVYAEVEVSVSVEWSGAVMNLGNIGVYRPTARARAWLTHFPTTTRLVAADRVPNQTSPMAFYWYLQPVGEELEAATLPSGVFEQIRDGKSLGQIMCEFPTAAAANDALARALAGLVWRTVNPLPQAPPG